MLRAIAGADPGEVKWVNFHPPFSEPPSFFLFFLSSDIEIIFDFSDIITKINPLFQNHGSPLALECFVLFALCSESLAYVAGGIRERARGGAAIFRRFASSFNSTFHQSSHGFATRVPWLCYQNKSTRAQNLASYAGYEKPCASSVSLLICTTWLAVFG